MRRLKQFLFVLPVLALLLSARPSQAQVSVGIGVGRGYPGYYGYGYGYPGFLPAYPGYYYPRSAYSIGVYGPGAYTYYPNYVQPSAYYYVSPGLSRRMEYYYSGNGYAPNGFASHAGFGTAPQDDAVNLTDADVLFNVKVAPDAEVWINGDKTSKTGSQREFISSGLLPGKTYTYEIRAKWTQDGKPVDRTEKVKVKGGERRSVDFRLAGE